MPEQQIVPRTYGRKHYRGAAKITRSIRRHSTGELANGLAQAFAAVFAYDAERAGEPEYFDQDKFTAGTHLLSGTALAEFEGEFFDPEV